jgi:hypothetical protein
MLAWELQGHENGMRPEIDMRRSMLSRNATSNRTRTAGGRAPKTWVSATTCGVVAASLALAVTRSAEASNKLAFDGELAYPEDRGGVERGLGAGIRWGTHWDLWLIELTPELGGSYHSFSGFADARAYRGVLGARLAVGFILEPSAFAHVGIGHVGYSGGPRATGVTYDAGVGLDLTLIPKVDLGAHAALVGMDGNERIDPLSWLSLGAHVAFEFDGKD